MAASIIIVVHFIFLSLLITPFDGVVTPVCDVYGDTLSECSVKCFEYCNNCTSNHMYYLEQIETSKEVCRKNISKLEGAIENLKKEYKQNITDLEEEIENLKKRNVSVNSNTSHLESMLEQLETRVNSLFTWNPVSDTDIGIKLGDVNGDVGVTQNFSVTGIPDHAKQVLIMFWLRNGYSCGPNKEIKFWTSVDSVGYYRYAYFKPYSDSQYPTFLQGSYFFPFDPTGPDPYIYVLSDTTIGCNVFGGVHILGWR